MRSLSRFATRVRTSLVRAAGRCGRRMAGAVAIVLIGIGAAGQAGAAVNDPGDPRQMVESVTEELRSALADEHDAIAADPDHIQEMVERLLTPHVDFDAMSAWVLGRYWKQASDTQRERFKVAFKRLLVKTYAAAVQHIEKARVDYLPERDTGKTDTAVIRTTVTPADSPLVSIDYYLHARNGPWQVYDLRIEGVSLIANYRSSYAAQVQAEGLDRLIQAIQDKVAASTRD